MIRWNEPKFDEAELLEVKEVLESGFVSEGPKTKLLEERLARIVGTKHVIMTTSCTAALYLALEADKRIKGYTNGKVFVPKFTFVGTKNAVELARLEPVIGSSIPLDARAALIVNLLGSQTSYDYGLTGEEAIDGDITLIADNAGCLGSNVNNYKVGCYSLQANKIITCGQGGFCATDDDKYAKEIRKIKDFGRDNKDQNHTTGFNFKFNDILAAVTLGQLSKLEERKALLVMQYLEYKNALGSWRDDYLGVDGFDIESGEIPLWVPLCVTSGDPKGDSKTRDQLFDYLKSKGIESRKPWGALIEGSQDVEPYTLWLPNGPGLTKEQQQEVINAVREFKTLHKL